MLKSHSVQSITSNDVIEIRVDTTIRTELMIQFNKPDIFVYDKKENMITIIEVGITSQDNLQKVEVKKLHKYDPLASEIRLLLSAKVQIVPIVLKWDAITTKFYPKYCQKLKLPEKIKSYIQSVILRAIYQSMNTEYKFGLTNSVGKDTTDTLCFDTSDARTPRANMSQSGNKRQRLE
ncbi:uncharacterized protein LOC115228579 [Octopus sinensis]|uniref:Uncharacterized protein LOC115228579 n=1 Tax=Octopus sinensis TaxID=2607531 RepID=A0A6P7U1Z5_9MOLL|nr:uncharacterized protein LOC115228579 [Octopus sinensis]